MSVTSNQNKPAVKKNTSIFLIFIRTNSSALNAQVTGNIYRLQMENPLSFVSMCTLK